MANICRKHVHRIILHVCLVRSAVDCSLVEQLANAGHRHIGSIVSGHIHTTFGTRIGKVMHKFLTII